MVVADAHTVPKAADWIGFSDMPPVFATAMMVGFTEQTCVMALHGLLGPGEGTVGTRVDMCHMAATPAGRKVTAMVELIQDVGGRLRKKGMRRSLSSSSCRDPQHLLQIVIRYGKAEVFTQDAAEFGG
jgi:predicted thioesterase